MDCALLHRLAFAIAAIFVLIQTSRANEYCHVADPRDPTLNIRKTPAGEIIGELPNELVVEVIKRERDSSGKVWAEAFVWYRGNALEGYVFSNSLRCLNEDSLPREKPSVEQMSAAGLAPQDAKRTFPLACSVVDNGWGVTISPDLAELYHRRGFSDDAMCLAFGGTGVFFDPETGRRLPLYLIPQGDWVNPQLHPLWVPDCFKSVEIDPKEHDGEIGWRPTGCVMKYHPSTGMRISRPDLVELVAGGPAGGALDEDNRSSTVSDERLRNLIYGDYAQ